jgi:hypothetical protein
MSMAISTQVNLLLVPQADSLQARANERGDQFEEVIRILLETLAFRVTRRLRVSGTEIDILAENLVTGQQAIVQCKDTFDSIDVGVLQKLHSQAVTQSIDVALLFCTSRLTADAQNHLRSSIRPVFRQFRVYGPNEIFDLLAASKSIHRMEVVEAFLRMQGFEAESWNLCAFQNRLYWSAPVIVPPSGASHSWVLLQSKGALVDDPKFLDRVEPAFRRRFAELGLEIAELPLLNRNRQSIEAWKAPLVIRETGLHSLLAGRPGFLRPFRTLFEFLERSASHSASYRSRRASLVERRDSQSSKLWSDSFQQVEALLNNLVADEVKDGLSIDELEWLLLGLTQLTEVFREAEARADLRHLIHELYTTDDSPASYERFATLDESLRPIIATCFGYRAATPRQRAIGCLLRLAYSVILVAGAAQPIVLSAVDSELPAAQHVRVSEIQIDHNEYRMVLQATSESSEGARAARQIEESLEKLLLRCEESLYLIGVRLFRVEIQLEAGDGKGGALGFRLHTRGLLQLLMGRALYDNPLVFVRELVQNGIDACRLRAAAGDVETSVEIRIEEAEGRTFVEITDNGIGMDRYYIERYLTTVGLSLYGSGDLQNILGASDQSFVSLGRFGIGFLSAFMMADELTVRTRMANADGLRVRMRGATDAFAIELLSDQPIGTSVRVRIAKQDAAKIGENATALKEYVQQTLRCPPVSINLSIKGETACNVRPLLLSATPESLVPYFAALAPRDADKHKSTPQLQAPMVFHEPDLTIAIFPTQSSGSQSFTRFGISVAQGVGILVSLAKLLFRNHHVHIEDRLASTAISVDRTRLTFNDDDDKARELAEAFVKRATRSISTQCIENVSTHAELRSALEWCGKLMEVCDTTESQFRHSDIAAEVEIHKRAQSIISTCAQPAISLALAKMPVRIFVRNDSGTFTHRNATGIEGIRRWIDGIDKQRIVWCVGDFVSKADNGTETANRIAAPWLRGYFDALVEFPSQLKPARCKGALGDAAYVLARKFVYMEFVKLRVQEVEVKDRKVLGFLPASVAIMDLGAIDRSQAGMGLDIRRLDPEYSYYRGGWIERAAGLRNTRLTSGGRFRFPYVMLDSRDPCVRAVTACLRASDTEAAPGTGLLSKWREALCTYLGASSKSPRESAERALSEISRQVVKTAPATAGEQLTLDPNWSAHIASLR